MKTKSILRSFALILVASLCYLVFSDAAGNTINSGSATTTCSRTICVTDLNSGNPVPNQLIYIYDSNGTLVDSCTTDRTGCCTPAFQFTDGAKYTFCDMSVACVTHCKTFIISCSTPANLTMFNCGN